MSTGDGGGQGAPQPQGGAGGTGPTVDEPFDKDRAMRTITAQRESEARAIADAKAARDESDALKARVAEFEAASLSEKEKAEKAARDATERAERAEAAVRETNIRASIEKVAASLDFRDPEDAVKQVDRTGLNFDDSGAPKGDALKLALEGLAKNKPYLVKDKGGSGDGGARRTSPSGTDMNSSIRKMAGRG